MVQPTLTLSEGWLWLGSSLFLAILWKNLVWFFRQPRLGIVGKFLTQLAAYRFSPWLLQILRLLYYVGLPFAALLWGRDAVIGRLLGLQRFELVDLSGEGVNDNWLDWVHDVGWAVMLGLGAWGLLTLGWWAYRRALATAHEEGMLIRANVSGWVLLREAAYHEIHWAFYRNAPIQAWGAYWGIWAGLALAALEAALNPAWRESLGDPQRAPAQLMRGALAVVSSVLLWLTQNLWLALALHWGVSWGLAALVRTFPLPTSLNEQLYVIEHVRSTTTPEQSTPPTSPGR